MFWFFWKKGVFDSFFDSYLEICETLGNPIVYLAECIAWFFRNDTYLITKPWKRKKVPSLAPLVKAKREPVKPKAETIIHQEMTDGTERTIHYKPKEKPKENVTSEKATDLKSISKAVRAYEEEQYKGLARLAEEYDKRGYVENPKFQGRAWDEDADKNQEMIKFVRQLDQGDDLQNLFNSLIDETGMYPYWYGCKWGLLIRFQHPLAPIRMHSLIEVVYGSEPSPKDRDPYPPIYVIAYDSMEAIAHKSWQVKAGIVVSTVAQSLKFDKDHRMASYFIGSKSSYF